MATFEDRDKYIQILNSDGLEAAVTALHHEMETIEFDMFEGPGGYRPEQLQMLQEMRKFSRELWDIRHAQPNAASAK